MSYIGRDIRTGAFRQLDDISSGFDGSDTTHTMQVNSTNVSVGDVNQILLSLGGVIQKPGTDFTVSGSTLTFTTAPAANTSFFAILLGSDNGGTVTPTDGSVTGDKLASTVTTSSNISLDGGTFIFNESGADKDFRIEGDTQENLLFVDASTDRVGIGTASPDRQLQVEDTIANGGATIGLQTSDSSTSGTCGIIHFGNNTDSSIASINGLADGSTSAGALLFKTEVDGGSIEERMRIHSDGDVSIGTTNGRSRLEVFNSSTGSFATDGAVGATATDDNIVLGLMNTNDSATFTGLAMETRTTGAGRFLLMNRWQNTYLSDLDFVFRTGASSSDELLKIRPDTSGGQFFFGAAIAGEGENPVSQNSVNSEGVAIFPGSYMAVAQSAGVTAYFNRMTDDGNVIIIRGQGTNEGAIAVSGTTVSFDAFTGSHWSRLEDNSKPTILKGTIMESLDKMVDWYQVEYTNRNNRVHYESISLPDGAKVGDDYDIADPNFTETKYQEIDIFYTEEDGDTIPEGKKIGDRRPGMDGKNIGDVKDAKPVYTGKIIKEGDVKHVYSKVSDTADSKKIYGVFFSWDDGDDGLDGDVNDFRVAQVGTYIIRVNKDVTVEAGDLLVSNGDGTAKKQDDDIIRSKTVAKVNSNVKVETYSDGSYTVPCTLHC